jgi:hypothetical protein
MLLVQKMYPFIYGFPCRILAPRIDGMPFSRHRISIPECLQTALSISDCLALPRLADSDGNNSAKTSHCNEPTASLAVDRPFTSIAFMCTACKSTAFKSITFKSTGIRRL